MSDKPYVLAVKALVRDEAGRFLILRRSLQSRLFGGQWDLPGGKVDPGEPFDAGLIREIAEETGLEIEIERVAGATEFDLPKIRAAVLIMEARCEPGEARTCEEHDLHEWVERKDLDKVEFSRDLAKFVRDYLDRAAT